MTSSPRQPVPGHRMNELPSLGRFPYSGLRLRPDFDWPDGKRLADHVAINLEHFVFGEGGVDLEDRSST